MLFFLFWNMQKRVVNHYFSFTRKERAGTIFLLFIILLLISIPFFYSLVFKEPITTPVNFQNDLATLRIKEKDSFRKYPLKDLNAADDRHYYKPSEKKYDSYNEQGELFKFDPNTLSAAGWEKLGVNEKTIATIQNYLSKGGKFRKPDDIEKIWGLHEDLVKHLLPFVDIRETVSALVPVKREYSPISVERKRSFEPVDINGSDTTAWIALPGIGAKLSNRIVNFRERLGGFYSIDQVAETFGLPDSVFQKIRPGLVLTSKNIKQININTATLDELKQHPYIRYSLANQIIQYRSQHGKFSSIDDIKRIMTVTDELYNKLFPYLALQ